MLNVNYTHYFTISYMHLFFAHVLHHHHKRFLFCLTVKSENFEKCKAGEKCYKCAKQVLDVKYKECASHNKSFKEIVSVNEVNIVSTPYLDYITACSATTDMSEENKHQGTLWYRENGDEEFDDIKSYKVGSLVLIDGGAAFMFVNYFVQLRNLRKVKGTRLDYADGSIGTDIITKENFVLNARYLYTYLRI